MPFSTNLPQRACLELALSAERGALKLDLIVTHISPIGERDTILDPRLTKHTLGYNALGVFALVVLIGLAFSREVSRGALIDYVAHFYDGALYCVRGTEAQRRISATLARSAGHDAYSGKGSDVYVLHLDSIEHAGPRKAEHIIVGKSRIMIAIGQVQVDGHVVHRRSLQVVPS